MASPLIAVRDLIVLGNSFSGIVVLIVSLSKFLISALKITPSDFFCIDPDYLSAVQSRFRETALYSVCFHS